jgi:Haem-binding domain
MFIKAKRILITLPTGIAGCLLIAQFITIQRTDPPLKGDLAAPPQIKSLLRGACYDCHSHETRWPWYTYITPVSWLVEHDVERGRQELNFSE